MGSTFSDCCYDGSESAQPDESNNATTTSTAAADHTGRSDLYHASWDPSEADDATQKAAADYSLKEVDEKDK